MSAQTITAPAPRLRVVPDAETKDRFWNLVTMKAYARRAWAYATSSIRSGLGWLRSTLHLDPIISAGQSLLGWAIDKVRYGLNLLGRGGTTGVVLTAVGTHQGRAILDATVGAGLRFTGRALSWTHDKVTAGLSFFGAPGRWAADRVTDVYEFFAGNAGKSGIIQRGKSYWKGALAYDEAQRSIYTRSLTEVGTMLVANRLITLASAFLPSPVTTLLRVALIAFQGLRVDGIRRDIVDMVTEERRGHTVVEPAVKRTHQQAVADANAAAAAVVKDGHSGNRQQRREAARAGAR